MNSIKASTIINLIFLTIALPIVAQADIVRCVDSAGKVSYSDKPCQTGQTSSIMKNSPKENAQIKEESPNVTKNSGSELSPECQHYGEQVHAITQDKSKSADLMITAVSAFERKCGKDAVINWRPKTENKNAPKNKPVSERCLRMQEDAKRKRENIDNMTREERLAFAEKQFDIYEACNE